MSGHRDISVLDHSKHFEERIASVFAGVAGFTKRSPDAAQHAASLQTERTLEVGRNVAELVAKVAERRRARREQLQAIQQLLVDALAETTRIETVHLSTHAVQAGARRALDDCVNQNFDDRIEAAKCASATVLVGSPVAPLAAGAAEAGLIT